MIRWILKLAGKVLLAMPELLQKAAAGVLGDMIYYLIRARRHTLLSNLHHVYPDQDPAWLRRTARRCCRRMAETMLFVLAAPQMSDACLRGRFSLHPAFAERIRENDADPRPIVALVPHFSLMESLTLIPFLAGYPAFSIGVIYRPLDAPVLDRWARETRGRHGMKLLSRKQGYHEAMSILRDKGTVAILFDQNTGDRGVLTPFCGRVASTTELPGLLSARFNALNLAVYTERTGFWRGVIRMEELGVPQKPLDTLLHGERWLEGKLAEARYRDDWLWLHDRWRNQDVPSRRFRLQAKKNVLEDACAFYGWDRLPRKTRFWIRMPNWLGDVVMTLPLLRALRMGRPDAELTVLVQPAYAGLLRTLGVCDAIIPLPARGPGYFRFFRKLRTRYPDTHILFTHSARSDFEAWCVGAPQRFGVESHGKRRRLLTHCWKIPATTDVRTLHQMRLWEKFFQHFGLAADLPLNPFSIAAGTAADAPFCRRGIGLICGTENAPEKRWPVACWRQLIQALPQDEPVYLFGTRNDAALAGRVADGFPADRLVNLAGKTSLNEFAQSLAGIRVLVSNDTGGMHLANALGTPVVGLFGPTNPVRTGPVFNAPAKIIQPVDCPPAGGMPMDRISPQSVVQAVANM